MFPLVTKIAPLVNSAQLLEIIIPALGFITANKLELIVEANPMRI